MATQSYQLVMRAGPSIGKVFPINKGEMHIGRDISNEIVINDAEVSRKHVRVVIQAGEVMIEDLGSTNGTFANEQRLSGPYTLVPGDTLQLGEHVVLVFEAALQASDATVAVPPGSVMPEGEYDEEATPLQPLKMPSPLPAPQYELPSVPAATDTSTPSFQPPAAPPKDNRRTIIIAVAIGFVLCCVCPAVSYAAYYALNSMGLI